MTENMRELKIFQFTMRGFANGGPVCDESLFVGPVVCFNHNNGFVGPHASALCLTDAQMAAGMSEDLIFEAVCEIVDGRQGRPVETLSIMSACQSDFVGIDFDSVTRRVRDELGIACVHVKNCRIMLKGHRDRGLVRGAARSTSVTESLFELGLSWEALRRGVPAEVDEGNEVLLLSGGAPFAPDNELLGALRDWGFTRVQTVGDWRSREGLARIRDLDWVLAAGEGAAPFARHVAQSLDVPMSAFSPTYRLSEVDAVYEELNERFGVKADVADARAAAEAAIELALSATEGVCAELDLMGFAYPWCTAHALYDMGFRFDALNIGWRRGPQPPFDMEEDDDYERFVKAYPEAADRVVNMTHEDRRHLFTPNPLAGPPRMAPVSERQFFGYRLIRACMERIVEEASREMSRENVSPTHFRENESEIRSPDSFPPASRRAMRGLFCKLSPFIPDSTGAMSLFADVDCLCIPIDLNGTISTYRKRIGLPLEGPLRIESATGVRELSYVMGSEDAFIDDIRRIVERQSERPIVLVHGPCSAIVGLDLPHLAYRVQEELGLPCMAIDCTGNDLYDLGLSEAMMAVYRRLVADGADERASNGGSNANGPNTVGSNATGVNVVGINRCDHADVPTREAYASAIARSTGLPIASRWGYAGGNDEWKRSFGASLTVVATVSGVRLARALHDGHGIPYAFADEFALDLCDGDTAKRLHEGLAQRRVLVVGEQITSNVVRSVLLGGFAQDAQAAPGTCRVGSFFTMLPDHKREGDVQFASERDFAAFAAGEDIDLVLGDPALVPLLPSGMRLFPFEHPAVSNGRSRDALDVPATLTPQWFDALARFLAGFLD